MPIQKISFDLWNTLIKPNPAFKLQKALYFAKLTGQADYWTERIIKDVDLHCTISDEITGLQTPSEKLILLILEALEYDIKKLSKWKLGFIYKNILKIFFQYSPTLYDENTKSVLEQLSKKHKLVLASNTGFIKGKHLSELLRRLDIKQYISEFYYSDQLGVCKPNALFFKPMYSEPDKGIILHVGDSESADLKGAKNYKSRFKQHIEPLIINTNGTTITTIPQVLISIST